MKSRRLSSPGDRNRVTRNHEVWRLSLGPDELATEYLMSSWPVLVAWSSGTSPRLPRRVMRARERGDEVLKARSAVGAAKARRARKDDILVVRAGFFPIGGLLSEGWALEGWTKEGLGGRG